MRLKKFYYKKIKSTNNKALMHIKKGREKGERKGLAAFSKNKKEKKICQSKQVSQSV